MIDFDEFKSGRTEEHEGDGITVILVGGNVIKGVFEYSQDDLLSVSGLWISYDSIAAYGWEKIMEDYDLEIK